MITCRVPNCPMCLLTPDVPVNGTELHFMRTPRRPDYVPEGHIYVSSEFQIRRRLNLFRTIGLWVMILLIAVTAVALYVRWTDNVGADSAPVIVVTPTTYGPPPA